MLALLVTSLGVGSAALEGGRSCWGFGGGRKGQGILQGEGWGLSGSVCHTPTGYWVPVAQTLSPDPHLTPTCSWPVSQSWHLF